MAFKRGGEAILVNTKEKFWKNKITHHVMLNKALFDFLNQAQQKF